MSIVIRAAGIEVPGTPVSSSTRLAWRPEFEVGHHVVDQQHRSLFGRINGIFDAVHHRPQSRIIELLDILITDVMHHFRDEEAILARAGYQNVRAHAKIHRELMVRMLMHRHDVEQATLPLPTLLDFLADELVVEHILGADRVAFQTHLAMGCSRP